jgi:hypothetical protein
VALFIGEGVVSEALCVSWDQGRFLRGGVQGRIMCTQSGVRKDIMSSRDWRS